MFNFQDKQTGGAYLGEGGYGCVFRPNISCEKGKFSEKDKKYISKIMPEDHGEEEFEVFRRLNIRKIDTKQKYLIYALEKCDIPKDLEEEDIYRCDKLRDTVNNFSSKSRKDKKDLVTNASETYTNLIQPYGGKTLKAIRINSLTRQKKKYECKDYVLMYLDLLKAMLVLNQNNLCHRDIKYDNIVVSEINSRYSAKLIDFGLAEKFVKDVDIDDEEGSPEATNWSWLSNNLDNQYYLWPVDLICYCKVNGGSYSRFKQRIDKLPKKIDKINEIFNIADAICSVYSNNMRLINEIHIQLMFTSCIRYLIDLFINNIYEDDMEHKLDEIIQNKWDIFMLGVLFSEELRSQRIEEDDGNLDDFFSGFAELIILMTNLNPVERIGVEYCVKKYIEILDQNRLELEIGRTDLENEKEEIKSILKNKKIV